MRDKLIEVFNKNQEFIAKEDWLVEQISASICCISVYPEYIAINNPPVKSTMDTMVAFNNFRSVTAAKSLHDIGIGKIAIVDFANHRHVGGGCRSGRIGQEEDLCRNTTLYNSISSPRAEKYYNNMKADIMYVPNVYITSHYKDDILGDIEFEDTPFPVDVIVTAAPMLIHKRIMPFKIQYKKHFNRATRILKVAYKHKMEAIITGAFGCGAFHNDPKAVAMAWNDAIMLYGGHFKFIIFSICEKPGYTELMDTFSGIIENKI